MVTLRADEERVVEVGAHLAATALQAGDLLRLDARAGVVLEQLPKAEVEDLVLEEVPNITYADVGRPRGPDRPDPGRHRAAGAVRRAFRRPQAHPAEGGPALRAARAAGRPSSPRPWPTRWPSSSAEQTGTPSPGLLPERQGARAAEQVRGGDGAEAPRDLRPGQGEGQRRLPRGDLLRRDGLPLPHPRLAASPRMWSPPSSPSSWPSWTGWRGSGTSSSSAPATARI